MAFLTLNFKGVFLAILFGIAFFELGLNIGYYFILTMVLFLILSAIATNVGRGYKKHIGVYQGYRGVKNVIANGLVPLMMAIAFYFSSTAGKETFTLLSIVGFIASVAAVTADKFNSEIGVFGGVPRMIFNFKKVRRGTSGGITLLGLLAGLFAALLISLTLILIVKSGLYGFDERIALISITLGGFLGSVVDSMLGYFEERGVGNKFTSNLFCSLAGGIAAMIIFLLI